jgi:hypothetical protein
MIIENDKLLLAQYLSEIRFKKYSLGEFDCVLFVADWIDRLTGGNWTKDIKGKYASKRDMLRFAKKYSLEEFEVNNPEYKEISRNELPAAGDIWWYYNKTHYTGFIIFQGFAWCVMENNDGIRKDLLEDVDLDHSPSGYAKRFRRI